MKFFTIVIALLITNFISFAQNHPCPISLHRNNGNGAPCGSLGDLQLTFTTCPTVAPKLDSLFVNGAKYAVTFTTPLASTCDSKGNLRYCIISGNTPPTGTWDLYFTDPTTNTKYVCSTNGVLPISIKAFNTTRNKSFVQLNWETSLEVNGEAFVIERKTGNDFVTVATVAANNIATGSSYSFTDNNNVKNVSEYRLKLISKDAAAKYSETRSVKGTGNTDFTIYPNPATRNAKISISDINKSSTVQVSDNTGRIIKTLSFKTSNTVEINGLERGIYRVQLMDTNSGVKITKILTIL